MNTAAEWSAKLISLRAALALTSYERVHVLAERAKHKPVYIDSDKLRRRDFERMSITLLTRDGVLRVSTIKRPTEAAAELAIMHKRVELPPAPVVLIRKAADVRYCTLCDEKKPLDAFIKSGAHLHGYIFGCKACRAKLHDQGWLWRRAG